MIETKYKPNDIVWIEVCFEDVFDLYLCSEDDTFKRRNNEPAGYEGPVKIIYYDSEYFSYEAKFPFEIWGHSFWLIKPEYIKFKMPKG